jgi:hypothetical protein
MLFPVVLGLLTLLGLAIVSPSQPPLGKGAKDVLPPGWTGPPKQIEKVKASSGKTYNVSAWPQIKGDYLSGPQDYFVAELEGDPNIWIAWIRTVNTGDRRLFRAGAESAAQRDAMMSDFQVKA